MPDAEAVHEFVRRLLHSACACPWRTTGRHYALCDEFVQLTNRLLVEEAYGELRPPDPREHAPTSP